METKLPVRILPKVYKSMRKERMLLYCTFAIRSPYHSYWRGHLTSPSVVSLKGRLPQKFHFKSTLSCEIVHIHSLFRHCFIIKKKELTEIENRRTCIMLSCDGFRKTDLGIDLIANVFRGSIQNTRLLSIFLSFIFCSIFYLFDKRKGAYS